MESVVFKLLLTAVFLTTVIFELVTLKNETDRLSKKQKKVVWQIRVSSLIALALQFFSFGRWLRLAFYLAAYLIIGWDVLRKAALGVKNKRLFSESFLMAVATLGALAIAVYENGDYLEAVAVMLFYQLGELFQSYAVGKSRRSIGALMDIRPDSANVEIDGTITQVSPETVELGSIIVVKAGEKIAIDGIIVEGSSSVNTVALTGESLPRDVAVGDEVKSGSVNVSGLLRIKTTKLFEESTASKILNLIENASSRKAKSEDFISKFARIYTPAVCIGALALAIIPPLFRLAILGASADFGVWVYRALTFLVISCPCALVISVPLTFFAGIGGAGRQGILIKGSNYMETLSKTKTVVFDKTGTLTKGCFEVVEVKSAVMEREKLLELAAYTEASSLHPIAEGILRAYSQPVLRDRIGAVRELAGLGIIAEVDGKEIAVGNTRLMEKLGAKYAKSETVGAEVYVAVASDYVGSIILADTLKPTSEQAMSELEKIGVNKRIMLTGDIRSVACAVGEELGVDEVFSELLPEDKVRITEQLIQERKGNGSVVAVGDGINDAPVLAAADVGIAMGGIGSDAAIEAADIVIMDDKPEKVAKAIKISRRCMTIVRQNVIFALGVKALCLLLGAVGIANMWLAIFADVGVMVLAVLNAIRALATEKI